MDRQTKHEIWLLAIGTIIFEVPVVAVAALAIWATKIARPEALGFFFRGAAMPTGSALVSRCRIADDRSGIIGKYPGHRRQVAEVRFMTRNSARIAAWFVVIE
jgi:hypothetical protein